MMIKLKSGKTVMLLMNVIDGKAIARISIPLLILEELWTKANLHEEGGKWRKIGFATEAQNGKFIKVEYLELENMHKFMKKMLMIIENVHLQKRPLKLQNYYVIIVNVQQHHHHFKSSFRLWNEMEAQTPRVEFT
ncbi:unnamed protein product [Rhizophagus irregularis]|nr:unnamed protein product [Rhizophagus irregularis]